MRSEGPSGFRSMAIHDVIVARLVFGAIGAGGTKTRNCTWRAPDLSAVAGKRASSSHGPATMSVEPTAVSKSTRTLPGPHSSANSSPASRSRSKAPMREPSTAVMSFSSACTGKSKAAAGIGLDCGAAAGDAAGSCGASGSWAAGVPIDEGSLGTAVGRAGVATPSGEVDSRRVLPFAIEPEGDHPSPAQVHKSVVKGALLELQKSDIPMSVSDGHFPAQRTTPLPGVEAALRCMESTNGVAMLRKH
mmetsp:Transcript_19451/g.55749  ORF Transcript_19451/g.55749 Transcript_19451/m.55749 type:complete len:247 (+) Transcript_19451:65-805(+)